ncbi:MAG TPA: S8 family serine peptidase [Candidatus Limnocylindrales bacterium]
MILATLTQVTVSGEAHPAPGKPDEKLHPVARDAAGRTPTSRSARTDRTLLGRTDTDPIPVIVKLDHDPVASYRGGIPGFAATSPSATGRRLSHSDAEVAYERYLEQQEQRFTEALTRRLPAARVGQRLRTVYGGVAVTVPANRIKDLLELDDVVAVQKDELRQPLTDSSAAFIGADRVERDRRAGRGVVVGVLDTGAWPEHPSFEDQGNVGTPPRRLDGRPRECDFGDGFRCNNKLIGGQAFLDSYLSVNNDETFRTARDSDGHGTHTASTAAGNLVEKVSVFGVDRGPIRGVAPGAWVSVYKVCGMRGCMSSDSAMAVAQAIRDGVDVINFSISGGTDPFTDPVEMAFLDAYAAGVFVAASAGNAGPGAGTVNHLSPWVTTVAASTQLREFASTLALGDGKTFDGASITDGVGPAPVVRNGKCLEPAKPNSFTGKIVVCERGGNARVEKGWNVLKGGAVGMILYNPTLQDVETDNHWLPTVHLPDAAVLPHLADGTTATIGKSQRRDGKGDVMAGFSSRGPAGLALKPDVTAPGVQILAGHTPVPDETTGGPQGELFQAIAGTSMSSPHVAGAAALLASVRPNWTPGQIKSALMTTATTEVVKEDLATAADPLDMGAGRIAVDRAARAGVTISETADRMLRFADDEIRSVDLNLPSINMPVMPGRLATTRVLSNDTGTAVTYAVKSSDSAVTVDRASVTVPAHGTAELRVTVSSRANDSQWRFSEVSLTPRSGNLPALHLPVAFRPMQGRITLSSGCDRPTVTIGHAAACHVRVTNTGYEDTEATVTSKFDDALRPILGPTSRQAALPGIRPGVPKLSNLDDRRYRSLGVEPDPVGDEEMLTYDTSPFTFAGQTHRRISVSANGYVVVGGGTVQDIRSEAPLKAGDERPNNLLAPYWTDLDGTGEQGVRVANVQQDGHGWLVVDWHVKHYGIGRKAHFQLWIGTGDTERIRFAYDAKALPGGAKQFAVGAENALGAGVLRSDEPSADIAVTTSGFQPGGTLEYTVPVQGVAPSAAASFSTSMNSPGVPGTTIVHTKLAVVSP